jgi:hypothetical protein
MASTPVWVGVLACQAANLMLICVIRRYEPRRPDRHPDTPFSPGAKSVLRSIWG